MKRLLIAIAISIVIILAIGLIFLSKLHKNNLITPVSVSTEKTVSKSLNTHSITASSKTNSLSGINVPKLISVASADGLKPKTLKAALNSYAWASQHKKLGSNKKTLTVVDFSLPSYKKRMWVLDLKSNKVVMKLYTTHGKGSGGTYATHFSNRSNTNASSLGLYVTSDEYYGKHDRSMHVDGLEKGINSNARNRSIVIHDAYYATPEYINSHGTAGRSWGCFAIAPATKNKLFHEIRGGSAFFTYAAQEDHDLIVRKGPIAIV